MKTITITLENEKNLGIEMNEALQLPEVLGIFFNAQMATMNRYVDIAREKGESEEILGAIKEDIWHMYNQAASNVLDAFIPDKELRPDITVEAMLEMENKLIDAKYEDVSKGL